MKAHKGCYPPAEGLWPPSDTYYRLAVLPRFGSRRVHSRCQAGCNRLQRRPSSASGYRPVAAKGGQISGK
jgi:hypothetical protein